jgi:Carboxypeptidase regulatory-like domain
MRAAPERARLREGSARIAWLALLAIVAIAVAWVLSASRIDAPARSKEGGAASAQREQDPQPVAVEAAPVRAADPRRLSGLVLDRAGAPVHEAKCSAVSLARGEHYEVETESDGRFAFARFPEGELQLLVEAEGFLTHNEAVGVGDRGERTIALRRRPTLRGRVLDAATNAPMRDFVVALMPLEEGEPMPFSATPPPGSTPFSSADGAFEIAAPAHGAHALLVFAERGAPWGERIDLPPDAVVEREVRVASGIRVRGRVRDARGDLVVEASVRLASLDGPQAAETTGIDGSFAMPTLPAGDYELLVLPQASPFLLQPAARLRADEPEPFWELTLPEPAALSGSVTPWTEGGVAEVVVRHDVGPVRRVAVDRATGAFVLGDLSPGNCVVHVERSEPTWKNRVARALASEVEPVPVRLVAGSTAQVRVLDAVPSLARARGRVLGLRDGEPCVVRAFCESRPMPQTYEGLLRASPQPDGAFEIEGLVAGRWRIQAMRGDDALAWQSIEVAAAADVEVSLRVR